MTHWGIHGEEAQNEAAKLDGPSFDEMKKAAELSIDQLIASLRAHVSEAIDKIERVADKYGIVVNFDGLPPFDQYGNSGWYLPKNERGIPWYDSSSADSGQIPDQVRYNAESSGWVSSSETC